MDKEALLRPIQVQFAEQDRETYGADWYTYDELALITRPARDLIRMEAEIGITIVDAMTAVRQDAALGDTFAAWVAVRASGSNVAFLEFSPSIMLASWRAAPVDEAGPKDSGDLSLPVPDDPQRPPEHVEGASIPTTTSTGTAPADTYVLPTLPRVGSGF